MRAAGWRTRAAFHLRALGRRLLIVRYDLEVWLEQAFERHIAAPDPWDDAMDEILAPPAAIPWVGPNSALYPDGRADVWVEEVGPGREGAMVDAYLRELTHISPREILG
jgi:hypothetical protein